MKTRDYRNNAERILLKSLTIAIAFGLAVTLTGCSLLTSLMGGGLGLTNMQAQAPVSIGTIAGSPQPQQALYGILAAPQTVQYQSYSSAP